MNGSHVPVELSPGEALDRLTILDIKLLRLVDPAKRAVAARERAALAGACASHLELTEKALRLRDALREVNERLWLVEDDLRAMEARGEFGDSFVARARSVYLTNDRRGALKQALDHELGARFHDVKSHDLPDVSDT